MHQGGFVSEKQKVNKDYLIGIYGTVMVFNSFSNLEEMEVEANE